MSKPKIPPYDPTTTTLAMWLEETATIMRANPKARDQIRKERAKILAPKLPS